MPSPARTQVARTEPAVEAATRPAVRWLSLDACKAVALFGMVAHHLAAWTGGRVRERWIGFDGLVITDLAAPMFAIALGAGAYLVGLRLADQGVGVPALVVVVRHWSAVALVGVAIDIANGSWVDGGGVLYTLAVLGPGVTLAAAWGVRRAATWWGIAAGAAVVAGPIVHAASSPTGVLPRLWDGPFALGTYAVFAAVGAAVVAHAGGRGEGSLPLLRGAGAIVGVGTLLAVVVPASAPNGLWPPMRYPGDLAYTVWGSAASLLLWAVLRRLLRGGPPLARALTRAGRRTLWVFGLHFVVRVALQQTDRFHTLTTWRWGLVAWLGAAAICLLASVDAPRWVRRRRGVLDARLRT